MTGNQVEVDRDALLRCIAACDALASDMADLRLRASRELAPDNFGLGETHLLSAAELAERFRATAVGGTGVAEENTAVGVLAAHERYARAMKEAFEAVLARYDEQDAATARHVTDAGTDL
ncbi:hypothetical protein [Rhodococcus tibetensis]|uniref:PE family protein n=1 Tax=Rhodococcus tibetensis TaxID=2965064 RepID=A0ABT1QHA3_9NOCA|nr:hypothetical protein [Rhodococcus sp. FXJ9.536]MCQ4121673.1 hypothetical protein [Rhodococcus sp. FXJ9.536]